MHLTNYSVNKHNENFERDETIDKGSKRSVAWFSEFLQSNDFDVAKFWNDVSVSVQIYSTLSLTPKSSFIYGFILIFCVSTFDYYSPWQIILIPPQHDSDTGALKFTGWGYALQVSFFRDFLSDLALCRSLPFLWFFDVRSGALHYHVRLTCIMGCYCHYFQTLCPPFIYPE